MIEKERASNKKKVDIIDNFNSLFIKNIQGLSYYSDDQMHKY